MKTTAKNISVYGLITLIQDAEACLSGHEINSPSIAGVVESALDVQARGHGFTLRAVHVEVAGVVAIQAQEILPDGSTLGRGYACEYPDRYSQEVNLKSARQAAADMESVISEALS